MSGLDLRTGFAVSWVLVLVFLQSGLSDGLGPQTGFAAEWVLCVLECMGCVELSFFFCLGPVGTGLAAIFDFNTVRSLCVVVVA